MRVREEVSGEMIEQMDFKVQSRWWLQLLYMQVHGARHIQQWTERDYEYNMGYYIAHTQISMTLLLRAEHVSRRTSTRYGDGGIHL